ncbi:hypothetical protein GJ496_002778 [Pomphorhynchus laevis]|nr:hypothetical protein GJ496_002778 [Pomphorhynchus laevis]
MRFFSNDEPVINISNDSTDLSDRTTSVGVMSLYSVVPPACDDMISPLIYDDQEQHLESIQTCQRNDNGIGAGLNIAAPCRRHSCERIRSPTSFGFPTSIGRPDLTSRLVYFTDSFDGDGPLKEWAIPSKPDKPQCKFVVATKKYSNESKSIGLKTTKMPVFIGCLNGLRLMPSLRITISSYNFRWHSNRILIAEAVT